MKIRSSEITPEHVYRARPRRAFLKASALAAGAALLAACGPAAAPARPRSPPE